MKNKYKRKINHLYQSFSAHLHHSSGNSWRHFHSWHWSSTHSTSHTLHHLHHLIHIWHTSWDTSISTWWSSHSHSLHHLHHLIHIWTSSTSSHHLLSHFHHALHIRCSTSALPLQLFRHIHNITHTSHLIKNIRIHILLNFLHCFFWIFFHLKLTNQ